MGHRRLIATASRSMTELIWAWRSKKMLRLIGMPAQRTVSYFSPWQVLDLRRLGIGLWRGGGVHQRWTGDDQGADLLKARAKAEGRCR